MHFFVLGLALYGLSERYWAYQQRQLQCPRAGQIDTMVANWTQQHRQPAGPDLRAALNQSALDEQMLIREAQIKGLHKRDEIVLQRLHRDAEFLGISGSRAEQIDAVLRMGLLESDEVIRRRLIQIQEQQVAAGVAARAPSEEDLQSIFAQSPTLAERPARYSFEQHFFAGVSDDSKQKAEAALVKLERAEGLLDTDVFLSGESFKHLSDGEIDAIFGPGFWSSAAPVMPLDEWFGPLQSVYGWHLIKLQAYFPSVRRDLAELRPELRVIWQRQEQRLSWQAYITGLRAQYRVSCHDAV
ncbi:peptidyl-prolyl cis-trans isomerase [Zhongshania sp.]|uniref:peptidylprolyl isomerase n=2 Tax=Zhongshania sp. TaxID=1971902 RepID=UPI00356774A8